MREEIREVIKLAAMDNLAERAGLTPEKLQRSQQAVAMDMQPPAMPPAMPPSQPRPNQMTTPMQVNLGNSKSVANLQRTKDMLTRDTTPLKEAAMKRMSPPTRTAARGGQALEDFAGQVPGQGHGMEDNVYMPIVDSGDQVATLAVSPDEYVVDAHTMSALGNGSADAGAEVMDQIIKEVRQEAFGTTQQPNQINGLQSLRNKMIG
tara:strand:- start:242 stop:859 length:618 start_codon:yes stop_codon:yes gene_type:complete